MTELHPADCSVLRLGLVYWELEQAVPELEVGVKLCVGAMVRLRVLRDLLGLESLTGVATSLSDDDLFIATMRTFEELEHLLGWLLELTHGDDVRVVPLVVVVERLVCARTRVHHVDVSEQVVDLVLQVRLPGRGGTDTDRGDVVSRIVGQATCVRKREQEELLLVTNRV